VRVPLDKVCTYLVLLSEYTLVSSLLNRPGVSNIAQTDDIGSRLLLLSQTPPSTLQTRLEQEHLATEGFELQLDFESFDFNSVFSRLFPVLPLPQDLNVTAHIAAVRLLPVHSSYKALIGELLLMKTPARTAVGITGQNVEVLAGEPNLEVLVKERGCFFNYDFAQFPELSLYSAERERICREVGRSVVCQLGAEVGMLSVLMAKQGCTVIANETSQYGYSQLINNAIHSKVSSALHAYCCDPADLLVKLVTAELTVSEGTPDRYFMLRSPQVTALPKRTYQHLIVNEPEPYKVLEVLYGLFKTTAQCTPTLHFYETCDNPNVRQEVFKRLNAVWRYKLNEFTPIRVHCVRGRLYCISLELPASVTQANDDEVESEGEVEESLHHAETNVASRMQQEISFMRQSIQDLVSPDSLLLSHLPSLFLSTVIKRKAEEQSASPSKMPKS
jgi:tRNA G37 N-methylase Trm5